MLASRAALVPSGALDARKGAKSAGTLLASQDMNPLASQGAERFAAPAWVVAIVGAVVVLSGVMYFLWRARWSRRAPSGPTSVRPPPSKIR